MKDYPSYTTLKYYYSKKKTSPIYIFDLWGVKNKKIENEYGEYCGSLLLTEDGRFYFQMSDNGSFIMSEDLRDKGVYPNNWINIKEMEYHIKYQPFDFDDVWRKTSSMYSKDFLRTLISDIRDMKVDFINDKLEINQSWIKY